jgi:amino-acid N-acetyltransferase
MNTRIEAADARHWPKIRALLTAAGLPTADLDERDMGDFLVAISGIEPVAAIALQRQGKVGLLRSLVVAADWRGKGMGAELCQALEARALTQGVTELWLLTMDAGPFFARHGFALQSRDDAPAAITGSEEFQSLCPASAELYCKTPGAAA